MAKKETAGYVNQMTDELLDAVQTVCMHCPYISDCEINEELYALTYDDEDVVDPGAKYCNRCMVRKMCELYEAEDKAQAYLPFTSPEWQAIIHY